MGYKLWAAASGSSTVVCETNSGFDKEEAKNKFGQNYAQKIDLDWDFAKRFQRITELVTYMQEVSQKTGKKCSRLAINAHGSPGLVDIESISVGNFAATGDESDENFKKVQKEGLNVDNINGKFSSILKSLNNELDDNAYVIFISCNAGAKRLGSEFLIALSNALTNASVVGFTRIVISYQILRITHGWWGPIICDYPGAKVTDRTLPSSSAKEESDLKIALLNMPFADENNQYAKVAKKGRLIKDPEPYESSDLPKDYYFKKLIRLWGFEIGDFCGAIGFEGDLATRMGKVYWIDYKKNRSLKHYGKWKALENTEISFEFDEDPPSWKRIFKIKLDASINNGYITIGGVPHGFFKIIDIT